MRYSGIIFFVVMLLSSHTKAQNWLDRLEDNEPVTRKTILKLDVMSPVYDMFNPELEFVLNEESSVTVELIWQSVTSDAYDFAKAGGRINYRFYLGNRPAPAGIYVAAGLGFFDVEGTRKRVQVFTPSGYTYVNQTSAAKEFASFIWLGRQSVFKNRISLEYALGTGYTFNPVDFERDSYWARGRYAIYGNVRIGFLIGSPASDN